MTGGAPGTPHHRYIDCVRGYAILLVIATHVTDAIVELPYPVKRITSTGWFGVQLFFLGSALTLLMSWHSELRRKGRVSFRDFFIRRFLRIAPAYYLAAIGYFFLAPPADGFDPGQALRTVLFVNAWHPDWTSTTGRWIVVPGGWSISVEFTFYLLFPALASMVTSLRRALLALLAALGMGVVANSLAVPFYETWYSYLQVVNFAFFWFPNQLSVFACGFVLFFLIVDQGLACRRLREVFDRYSALLGVAGVLGFVALNYVPQGHFLGDRPWMPAGQAICVPMMVFILALACGRSVFVNSAAAAMGRVSFSAYLIHFAVLSVLKRFPELFQTKQIGVAAIVAFGGLYCVTVLITFLLSNLTFRWVEQPMMDLARSLQRRHGSLASV